MDIQTHKHRHTGNILSRVQLEQTQRIGMSATITHREVALLVWLHHPEIWSPLLLHVIRNTGHTNQAMCSYVLSAKITQQFLIQYVYGFTSVCPGTVWQRCTYPLWMSIRVQFVNKFALLALPSWQSSGPLMSQIETFKCLLHGYDFEKRVPFSWVTLSHSVSVHHKSSNSTENKHPKTK